MVEIEFLSTALLSKHKGEKKIDSLVASLKKGKILVLEEPLSPEEETKLIEATMAKITSNFPGIEIGSLGPDNEIDKGVRSQLIRMLGGKRSGLTVIGPSKYVRQMKKNPGTLHLVAD